MELTVEAVVASGIRWGITIQDWESLTLGMIVDIIITQNNHMDDSEDDSEQVRIAGQADFDRF